MKRILVTGASGFIGKHTLPLLLKAGHEVYAVSLKKNNGNIVTRPVRIKKIVVLILTLKKLPSPIL